VLGGANRTGDAHCRLPHCRRETFGGWEHRRSVGHERLAGQGISDYGERAFVVVLTVIERSFEDREDDVVSPGAESELESPAAENVKDSRILGQPQRMLERQGDDPGCQPQPFRTCRGHGQEDQGRGEPALLVRVVLSHPADVVPETLRGLEQTQPTGVDLRWSNLVDQARKDAETERTPTTEDAGLRSYTAASAAGSLAFWAFAARKLA
jgi:hypothetical protein